MRLNRMLEDKLTALYRQGRITGGLYSSLGQEAISGGTAYALAPTDLLADDPQHRVVAGARRDAARFSSCSSWGVTTRRRTQGRTLHSGTSSRWRWSARSAISGPWCR